MGRIAVPPQVIGLATRSEIVGDSAPESDQPSAHPAVRTGL
jgi:hypothetical protein